jgi:hypothetical protein
MNFQVKMKTQKLKLRSGQSTQALTLCQEIGGTVQHANTAAMRATNHGQHHNVLWPKRTGVRTTS